MEVKKRVLVVGAGISGLSLAYWLRDKADVTLVEASDRTGGVIDTFTKDGFELDLGPVSCALTPDLEVLLTELGLTDKILTPEVASSKRYLYYKNTIHPVQQSLPRLLFHPMLSWRGRFKILGDLFQKIPATQYDESVYDFASRHFGQEATEKFFDPVLGGIYAGDIKRLSIKQTLPLLQKLEAEHGSVIKGLKAKQKEFSANKRRIIGLQGGFKTLIQALTSTCNDVRLNHTVQKIIPATDGARVTLSINGEIKTETFSQVYLTTPAYATAKMIDDTAVQQTLSSIPYCSVAQVHCTVTSSEANFDGFGFLIPSSEKLSLLGAVNNASLFPRKAVNGKILFTLFSGGLRSYAMQPDLERSVNEFKSILKLSHNPEVLSYKEWTQAIPQPVVGHSELIRALEKFEASHSNVQFGGNYRSGVSVGDCIAFSRKLADGFI